jgi:hypothetical protein
MMMAAAPAHALRPPPTAMVTHRRLIFSKYFKHLVMYCRAADLLCISGVSVCPFQAFQEFL